MSDETKLDTCPRCKQPAKLNFMWDCKIDGKQKMCIWLCRKCDDELTKELEQQ
jgi:hypothetical protein